MTLRRVLRTIAIVIAVATLIDPSFQTSVDRSERLTIVGTSDAAMKTAMAVAHSLAAHASTRTWLHDATTAAAACPQGGKCIVVSSGEVPSRISAGAPVLAVVDASAGRDAPVIERIEASSPVHLDATATMRVETNRRVERIDLFDGDVLVGSATPSGQTAVDLAWVPMAPGARALRIVADDTVAHTGVVVDANRAPILFYEPQASWLGTFVRRALEDDLRFEVRGRTRLAPPVSVTRGEVAGLSASTLRDVAAVFVTAPETLSAADVTLLESFVTHRGGSLIVLIDQKPTGAVLRLLPRVVAERREQQAHAVGSLRTSEWLAFDATVGVSAMASVDNAPVIVSRAVGRGRVVVSGALDAWRFRQVGDGFATFWTTLAWDAAMLAGPRLRVETMPVIARPGEEVVVTVELQNVAGASDSGLSMLTLNAAGQVVCGDRRQFLRLWPAARPGAFSGTLRVDSPSECTVTASVGEETGSTPVTIRDDLRPLAPQDGRLDALAAAYDAPVFTAGELSRLEGRVLEQLATHREPERRWPMRSPYWLLPFVTCLAAEWWLRRQSGLS